MTLTRTNAHAFFNAIIANAVFSAVTGGLMAFAPDRVAAWLGLTRSTELFGIGIFLLAFAGWLIWLAWRGQTPLRDAWVIVYGDLAWVGFSIVLLIGFTAAFSNAGLWLVGVTAFAVLAFALAQWRGIRSVTT